MGTIHYDSTATNPSTLSASAPQDAESPAAAPEGTVAHGTEPVATAGETSTRTSQVRTRKPRRPRRLPTTPKHELIGRAEGAGAPETGDTPSSGNPRRDAPKKPLKRRMAAECLLGLGMAIHANPRRCASLPPSADSATSAGVRPRGRRSCPGAVMPGALVQSPGKAGGGGKTPPPPSGGDDDEEDGDDSYMLRMSFLEHLEELRSRIIRSLIGIAVAFIVSIAFTDRLWDVRFRSCDQRR